MFKRSLLLGSILCLTSCAYALDEQIQRVTIETPGAYDAVCYMYVDGLRHKIHPPESATISKSRKNMVVDCLAPQNRRRKVIIEPALSEHAYLNVMNGVIPGTGWDLAANALYEYPAVITIDFTSAVPLAESLPAQNNPDIKQPEEYDLEEFTPNLPRLNSDRNAVSNPILRRGQKQPEATAPVYTETSITTHTGPGAPADKGDLTGVVDGLTTSTAKPAAPAPATDVSTPVVAPTAPAPAPAAVAPAAAPAPATTAPAATPAPATTPPAPTGAAEPVKGGAEAASKESSSSSTSSPATPTPSGGVGTIAPYPIQSKQPAASPVPAGPPVPLTKQP